jgi:hypothetical protein
VPDFSLGTGIPATITANPSTFNIAPGQSQVVTLTAPNPSVQFPPTLVALHGSTGGNNQDVYYEVELTDPPTSPPPPVPSFTLAATSAGATTATVQAGGAGASVALVVTPVNNFSSTVNLSIDGLPAGVTASPAALQSLPATSTTATMVTADTTATPGTYTLTAHGVDSTGTITVTATLPLVITAAPVVAAVTPVLSGVPTSELLTAGGQQIGFAVTLTSSQTAAMTVAYPNGVSGPAGPFAMLTGQSQQITLRAPVCYTSCGGGNVVLTVTSGTGAQVYSVPVTIVADTVPATFTLSLSSNSVMEGPGYGPGPIAIQVTGVSGYADDVVISFGGAEIPAITVPGDALGMWSTIDLSHVQITQSPTVIQATATGSDGTAQTISFQINWVN